MNRRFLLVAGFGLVCNSLAFPPRCLGQVAPDSAKDSVKTPRIVRALYANRAAGQSLKKMHHLIAIADTTEINAIVIDMKDEFGLNFRSSNAEWRKNAGNHGVVPNLKTLLDTIKAHDLLPIARIVVFNDSVSARMHPEWTIRTVDSATWRSKTGPRMGSSRTSV